VSYAQLANVIIIAEKLKVPEFDRFVSTGGNKAFTISRKTEIPNLKAILSFIKHRKMQSLIEEIYLLLLLNEPYSNEPYSIQAFFIHK